EFGSRGPNSLSLRQRKFGRVIVGKSAVDKGLCWQWRRDDLHLFEECRSCACCTGDFPDCTWAGIVPLASVRTEKSWRALGMECFSGDYKRGHFEFARIHHLC